EGLIHLDGADHAVREGSYAYIPGEALHQFTNSSSEPFVFICVVPPEGDQ
ncbi:MAG: cupin domain-containing protein, partial [Firmicutes bacterium]|nr:cupin domain-containing protein [Bacillota bacterium]